MPQDELIQFITAFNSLAIAGFLFLAAVLAPALFNKNILRQATWFSLVVAWMVYALAYLLIADQQLGSEPPFGLCFLQMSLIYSVPPLYVIASCHAFFC
jgi:hypothetical protein